MLPDNTQSSISFGGIYLPPDEKTSSPIVDYELGGVAINDAPQGLLLKVWRCWLDVHDVRLQREGLDPVTILQGVNISEIAFCFDQNMRWSLAFVQEGILKLRWFDSAVAQYVTTVFTQAVNPRLALDDKRAAQLQKSDMILGYIRGNTLFYRQQRDRFTIERTLRTNLFPNTKLKNIGMNKNLRLQFELV